MSPEPGVVTPGASADAVRRLVGDRVGPGVERRVSTDQANVSIAVDETWLVKWFTRPLARRDLAVVEHLARQQFAHTPAHVGAVVDDDGAVRAVVSELVAGATDGWEWYVADVLAWIDAGDTADGAGAASLLDDLVATAERMAAITADLHAALATAGTARASVAPIRRAIAARRDQAVDHTAGEPGDRLRARLGQIDAALAGLADLEDSDAIEVQRVHGDLHAGQFLRAGDRLLVIDFDGDPMTASADRPTMQPIERDVAALLQSLDHVGRVAAKRRPGADVTPFVRRAIESADLAYRTRRSQHPACHEVDDRLLWLLRVAQELHEYAYAALHLPVWTYVPDAAMCALFPEPDRDAAPDAGTRVVGTGAESTATTDHLGVTDV